MTQKIAVLSESGSELFTGAINIGVSVAPSKTFPLHTLENNQVVIDDQYDNQTMITLRVILDPSDYVNTYKEIKSYYEAVTNFSIQTKTDSYSNMYLNSIPHEEDPAMFNTIAMNLEFTQQIIVASTTASKEESDVSSASDTTTVESGSKSTTEDDGTIASRLYDRVFG